MNSWNEPTNYHTKEQPDLKPAASLSIPSVEGWSLFLPYLSRQKAALLCDAGSK